ncbi:MAG: 23S rRNA (adenine(1618)-N(6))-methyltransferase RlmF [Saccharospirillaceae bacterium]|nr:23S rRNA (adenine(1618)-N(6))-methyltransferase RlmF [Pseudomonadales bacterium]NRB77504.1 23S rRNA (adenine(1618)-N(6))-methyltransferase RlmF [Saccharospirillaceae bacterium]
MSSKPSIKKQLHPRNIHNHGYDYKQLIQSYPNLQTHVFKNEQGNLSIDFANSESVKQLNTAILKHDYKINNWDIPKNALCPPIPGRADYIHYVADLLNSPTANSNIKLLDIGTGANCIYPLLASQIYQWQCVGSDISDESLTNIESILINNPKLKSKIETRKQNDKHKIFDGIIQKDEHFDITVCNPPFHASENDAIKASALKSKNLGLDNTVLNFGGQANELWCNGGEKLFLKKMIKESKDFKNQVTWFTSLLSKAENLKPSIKLINKLGAIEVKQIEMIQGKKITRVLAWRF